MRGQRVSRLAVYHDMARAENEGLRDLREQDTLIMEAKGLDLLDLAGLRIENEALRSEVQRDKKSLWRATAQLGIGGEQVRNETASLRKKLEEEPDRASALQNKVMALRHDVVKLRRSDTKLRGDNARLAAGSMAPTKLSRDTRRFKASRLQDK